MAILKAGEVDLPGPVELSIDDEIIWSSNTGRTADATMTGDVLAEKKTMTIKWGILTETEEVLIKINLKSGFFPITFHDDGLDITIPAYRGTLSKVHKGYLDDGIYYYQSVSVSIIEQ